MKIARGRRCAAGDEVKREWPTETLRELQEGPL
jgi:hypothetical protein